VPGLDLHGLELQPAYAELARRNAAANGQTTTIHCGDLLRPPPSLRVLPFDHVLMNPPFHERAGARSPNAGRATARNEGEAGLADWIAAGLRRLRPGGSLCLIQRADRLAEILAALVPAAGAIEILPLAARAGSPAGRVLVRARKASRASLVLHAPLDVHAAPLQGAANESFTPAASRILRDAAPVLSDSRNGGSSLQGATRE
jgi:tRNA1(Val) A37 N6-methylase TrmN6